MRITVTDIESGRMTEWQFQADNTDSYQNLDTGQTHCLPSLDEYMGTLALNATRLIGPLCTLVDRINEKRSRK